MLATLAVVVPIASIEILPAGRYGYINHTISVYRIVQSEALLEVIAGEDIHLFVSIVGYDFAFEGRCRLVLLVGKQLDGNLVVALRLHAESDVACASGIKTIFGALFLHL